MTRFLHLSLASSSSSSSLLSPPLSPLSRSLSPHTPTPDYRLGAFGFLALSSGTEKLGGNFGLQDQQLALRWVQTNARSFGGDPANVVLWGQSAGAMSVAMHMMYVG